MTESIYLDYAAATPLDPAVLAVMQPYLSGQFYNPSATYQAAREVAQDLEAARSLIAHWLGARSSEIIFTAGGTEANNLAVHGIMRQYPAANMITSAIEHPSVLEPAHGYEYKVAPIALDGLVDVGHLEQLIDDNTVLVSVMHANNEIGTIQPVKRIAEVIKTLRSTRTKKGNALPLYFHTDACQTAAYLDLHVARLGVDLMTVNGGKIYGPKQSGALYVRGGVLLLPLMVGGGQERGLRSGTPNVAGSIGLAAALDMVQTRKGEEGARLKKMQQVAVKLLGQKFPGSSINGSLKHRLPNNIHLTLPGANNERFIMALDGRGIQCAAGSACSAAKEAASPVLAALGLDETAARSSLRFTMGRDTTEAKVQKLVSILCELHR